MNDGIHFHVPMKDYLEINAINASSVRAFLKSPLHLKDLLDGKIKDEPTDAMVFGGLLHAAFFEKKMDFVVQPAEYEEKILECPDCGSISKGERCSTCKTPREEKIVKKPWNNGSNVCINWHSKQTLPPITQDENTLLQRSLAVLNVPEIIEFIGPGQAEVTMVATDPATGLRIKCRSDWLSTQKRSITDLKSCINAATYAFQKEIFKRGYHIQAAMNRKVANLLNIDVHYFNFIALEKGEMPKINYGEFGSLSMGKSMQDLNTALIGIAACLKENKWPGYVQDAPNNFELPSYVFSEELNMDE